jgi:hypothetical protein
MHSECISPGSNIANVYTLYCCSVNCSHSAEFADKCRFMKVNKINDDSFTFLIFGVILFSEQTGQIETQAVIYISFLCLR